MISKIKLDALTERSVTVITQQYIVQDGKEYPISNGVVRSYINSTQGRLEVENEVTEPYKSVIFMIWGDAPTEDIESVEY